MMSKASHAQPLLRSFLVAGTLVLLLRVDDMTKHAQFVSRVPHLGCWASWFLHIPRKEILLSPRGSLLA